MPAAIAYGTMNKVRALPDTTNSAQIAVEDALFLQIGIITQVVEYATLQARVLAKDNAAVFTAIGY